MHIKFLAHGTGSGAGASAYLMREHDHTGAKRAGVEVLRGDPALFAAVADSLPFQQRYTSAVISWAAEEAPLPEEISDVLDDFEALAFAGLERESYHMTAVEHSEADGGVHVHILIPRVHLDSGKSFNPAPPGQRKDFDAVRDKHNHEKGWARPDDPLRARLLRPDFEAYKDASDKTAIKKQITDHLLSAVAQGVVSNAAELRSYLHEGLGCEITRTGKDYTSVKPEGYPKAIRLKGELYGESWTAKSTLEREATAAARARVGRGGEVNANAARDAQERLASAYQRRAKYNGERYQRRDQELTPADNRFDRPFESGFDAGPERRQRAEAGFQRLVQSVVDRDIQRRGRDVGELGGLELDVEPDRARAGNAANDSTGDLQRAEYAGRLAEGGEVRQRAEWRGVHHSPQDWGAVQDRERKNGRGGALNDRAGEASLEEVGADRTAAPTANGGLAAATRTASEIFDRVTESVQRRARELRETVQRVTERVREVTERSRTVEYSYLNSNRQLEWQCQRLEQSAGRIAQSTALMKTQVKEPSRAPDRGRGFEM